MACTTNNLWHVRRITFVLMSVLLSQLPLEMVYPV